MKQCPCCGKIMKFRMKWIGDYQIIYFNCECGYDERDEMQTTASTKAEYIKRND